jgi:hypothetical protein
LKGYKSIGATWSSGGNMNTARGALGGAGTQTAAVGFAGYAPGSSNATEKYDGSTWTTSGNLGTARYSGGSFGTQTAAVLAGGGLNPGTSNATEEFNGSTWSPSGNLNTARRGSEVVMQWY